MKLNKSQLFPFYNLAFFYLIVSLVLRIVLLFHPITESNFSFSELIKIFGLGLLSDFFVFIVASAFLWIYLIFLSDSKYHKPWGYIIFGILLITLLYLISFNTILNEYGGALPNIVIGFLGLKTFLFGFLLFIPKYRSKTRFILFSITIFIFVLLIIQNALSEFFFWNEFGVRYNFIAVNYLIYTNEVIGNIMESYPIIPLFLGIGSLTLFFTYFIVKKSKTYLDNIPAFSVKVKLLVAYLVLFLLSLIAIPFLSKQESSENIFANELESNGIFKFYNAFVNSELDYLKFYKTLPKQEAYSILKNQLAGIEDYSSTRLIKGNGIENHKNVVLITIESLSADFLHKYGNAMYLTPNLEKISDESLFFTNLYATGNRTIRGLEAVTLCIPPTAGESVVKRKDNKNKFSTGSIFKQKGYDLKYIYGGDAYFDNMKDFFTGNGYDIVDKTTMQPNEISFKNVWGVCDEDLFNKAINTMNIEAKNGKPFFNHIMTVSNHRPYTYPENKVMISPKLKMREGGVLYTDYAIGKFFENAKKQPWFKNTVFVIVADHCASSAGKTELPVDKYRIPAMIYAPGFIKPQKQTKLMSQIDLMPTLFGLLNFSYESKFYGQDVFKFDYKPRAFIATYQDLGLIKDNILTIISPVKKVKQFDLILHPTFGLTNDFQIHYDEKLVARKHKDLIDETISYYQTTSDLLKRHQYQKN